MAMDTQAPEPPLSLKRQLLLQAEEYCGRRGISEARLGFLAVNDGKFFTRIRAGGQFTDATFERFRKFFAENPPSADAA